MSSSALTVRSVPLIRIVHRLRVAGGRRRCASDHARQGTGRRLVRVELHHHARRYRRRVPDRPRDLRMVPSRPYVPISAPAKTYRATVQSFDKVAVEAPHVQAP